MGLFRICEKSLTFEEYILSDTGLGEEVGSILLACTTPEGQDDDICSSYDGLVNEYETEYLPTIPCKPNYLGIGFVLALGVGAIYLIRKRK